MFYYFLEKLNTKACYSSRTTLKIHIYTTQHIDGSIELSTQTETFVPLFMVLVSTSKPLRLGSWNSWADDQVGALLDL